MARAAAVVALLLLALLPPVEARAAEVGWLYEVDVTDPASGKVTVDLHLLDADGSITSMQFDTRGGEYEVSDLTGPGVTEIEDGVFEIKVDSDDEVVRYTVDMKRPAPGKPDEYASFLDAEGGVLKAEAFALRYQYSYICGVRFDAGGSCPADESPRFSTRLRFALPAAWSVEGPWPHDGEDAFALAKGEALPRGFFAVGPLEIASETHAGRTYRYARLGEAMDDVTEKEMFAYLKAATPYYSSVYGDVVGPTVFVVSYGDPMFKGGLAGHASLYIHRDVDLRTLAHEYAHVWQAFSGKPEPGAATIWVNEGDAEYHGTLSLFATGDWSLKQVNDFYAEAYKARTTVKEPLDEGVYGGDDAIAYKKGVVMMAWLDDAIKDNTDGAKSLSDLVKALNALYAEKDGKPRTTQLENAEVLATLNGVVKRDFGEHWDRYVHGPDWPPLVPVTAAEELSLEAVEFTPEAATPGAEVKARIVAANVGLTDVERTLDVTLDGDRIGEVTFDLPRDARTGDAVVTFIAPEAGVHEFKVGYLTAQFHSLAPASFRLDRISVVPATPRAGSAAAVLVYVENAGEATAPVTVRLSLDGAIVGEQGMSAGGKQTVSASFDVLFERAGASALRATLVGEVAAANATKTLALDVLPADRDGDGVPDDADAFPDNPRLSEPGAVSTVTNTVPAAGVLALVLVAAVALARRRTV